MFLSSTKLQHEYMNLNDKKCIEVQRICSFVVIFHTTFVEQNCV